jgi:hypothetical protein
VKALQLAAALVAGGVLALACSSSSEPATAGSSEDAGIDASSSSGAATDPNHNPTNDKPVVILPDGGSAPVDPDSGATVPPYATRVVSFTPGKCAGYGQNNMPNVVLGPPKGGGQSAGSTDVVSLGTGGEIVLSFEPNEVVDGPGVDLLVFENAFIPDGSSQPYAEPGEVSVSEDGVTWTTFPCTATAYPWGLCAGWHTVSDTNDDSLDPAEVGGDPFDLGAIGVTRAKFVKIVDKTTEACPTHPPIPTSNGFDLDAIAAVNSTRP